MDTAKTAAGILLEAERRLRDLVGTAATAGQYDDAERLTNWARAVGTLADDAHRNGTLRTSASGPKSAFHSPSIQPNHGTAPARARRAPVKGTYPRFLRRGDELVKIGWSKKERDEYTHKAPRRVIDALAAAIARRAANGRRFTSDDLLPLKDAATEEELPGYQAYVVLAWLKHTGLVKQHGRSGYSLGSQKSLVEVIETHWAKLPPS